MVGYHHLHNRCYPNFISNVFIPNPILSDVFTHSVQHSHLCIIQLIILLAFYCPIFSPTYHCRSYSCVVKISFKLEWYFSISSNTPRTPPLHSPSLNFLVYVFLYFPIILYNRPKILKSYDLWIHISIMQFAYAQK